MYEGIKLEISGKEVNLNSLPKNESRELELDVIKNLKIYVEGEAAYDAD